MSTNNSHDGGPDDPRLDAAWRELVRPMSPERGSRLQRPQGPGRRPANHVGPVPAVGGDRSGGALDIESLGLVETFGDVELLRGWDHALDRPVMIRALSAAGAACSRRSQEFWSGARVQAQLQHQRLIGVHVLDESRNWVVTECAKHSLAQQLRKGPLPAPRVRRFLEQALEGLNYLHEQGEVHGQIQPDSLLVDDQGNLKIDRPLGVQPDGVFLYRPGLEKYMAPEALDESRFGAVGSAVDLYSLGMTMLELLAGDRLADLVLPDDANFTDAADAWQKWHVSAAAQLPPIRTLLPKTPPRLALVLDRLLAKHVDDRFPSARDAYTALTHAESPRDDAVSQMPLPAVVPRPPQLIEQRPARRSPRSPLVATTTYVTTRSTAPERSRLVAWADKLADERTGNLVSVGVLLLAVFTAGSMIFSGQRVPPADQDLIKDFSRGNDEADETVHELVKPEPPESELVDEKGDEPPQDAPSPAPPPPVEAMLTVMAAPSTATVLIDGVELPPRSSWPRKLPPGTYRVDVRQWDYFPWSRVVTIAEGERCHVDAHLQPRSRPEIYEPPPLDGPLLPPEVARFAVTMLDELWWDVPAARQRYPNLMAGMMARHSETLRSDARVVHARALWELRLQKEKSLVRFEQAADLAPSWYSLPRKHVIRERLIAGDLAEVRQHAELLARALRPTTVEARSAAINHELEADAGRFLGAVSGLLEGPFGQATGLAQFRGQLPADGTAAFDEERMLVLQHYRDLARLGPSWFVADDLIDVHLDDTVVLQRDVLLRSFAMAVGESASVSGPRTPTVAKLTLPFAGVQGPGIANVTINYDVNSPF